MAPLNDDEVFKRPMPKQKSKQDYTIYELFNFAQKEETIIKKVVKKMIEVYEKTPFERFVLDFKKCLQFSLSPPEKCRQIDKLLQFVVHFVVKLANLEEEKKKEAKRNDKNKEHEEEEEEEEDEDMDEEMHPLLRFVFKTLFEYHNLEDPLIRYRVCLLTSKILMECSEIDTDIFEELTQVMITRIKDKMTNVRTQAVSSMFRLQERRDDCPIKEVFKFHLSHDPSADVRKTVARYIHVSDDTMPTLLGRLDDISDKVRKVIYLTVSKPSMFIFTIKQRQLFIQKGLKDRSKDVKTAVENVLLPVWFSRTENDYIRFLTALNVEQFEEPALQALDILAKKDEKRSFVDQFENLLNENYLIPIDELDPNKTLFWRFVTTFLHKEERQGILEVNLEENSRKLPELTPFTKYIRAYVQNTSQLEEVWKIVQAKFNLIQMLKVARVYNFKDEFGRSSTLKLCTDLLKSSQTKDPVLIESLVELLFLAEQNDDKRLDLIAEIIADLREPLVHPEVEKSPEFVAPLPPVAKPQQKITSLQKARLLLQKNELEENLKNALDESHFDDAQELCKKVAEVNAKIAALEEAEPPQVPSASTSAPKPSPMESDDGLPAERQTTTDPDVIRKCLRILSEALQLVTVQNLTPTLRSLLDNIVMPSLLGMDQDDNSLGISTIAENDPDAMLEIRKDACEALGLLCLIDEQLAVQRMNVFIFLITNPVITKKALEIIIDLLCKYGLPAFRTDSSLIDVTLHELDEQHSKRRRNRSNEPTLSMLNDDDDEEIDNSAQLMKILIKLLYNGFDEQKNILLMGFSKLLFLGRINSPILLSKLIIHWFSPDSANDLYIQQQLGNFFSKYASMCPQAPDILCQATLPSIEAIAGAPPDSPLGEIDVDNALKLLITLTAQQRIKPPRPHDVIAKEILEKIIHKKSVIPELVLIKSLHKLNLSYDVPDISEELLTLAKSAENSLKDEKSMVQKMKTFRIYLEAQIDTHRSTLINTRVTMDNEQNTRDRTRDSRTSSIGLGLSTRDPIQTEDHLNLIPEEDDNEVEVGQDEQSQKKHDELERRLQLLNLKQGLVQGSSDEEEEEDDENRASGVTRRLVIPPTPECTDDEMDDDDNASTCSGYSGRRPSKMPRRF